MKFALGERTLFRVNFTLAVKVAHFTELAEDAYCTWSQWSSVPASVDGVLIRSQPVSRRLSRLSRFPDSIRYVPAQYQRYYLEFGQSFADYLQKFSSQTRSKRKKEVRKFAESAGGSIDIREYRTPDEVREFMRHARELSRKTFQERLLDAGLPASEEFQRHILDQAAKGKVRAYLLFHAGLPASYLLNEIRDPGIVISLYTGYEPQFRSLSPGTIVYYLAFEKLFAESGLHMLDFTEGEGTHKQFFATASKQCADIYFFRSTFKIRTLLYTHSAIDFISRSVVKLLDNVGLKARIKKLIRARA